MKFNTVRFGEIDIDENRIFEFVLPIIGFDTHWYQFLCYKLLLEPGKETLFKWLQSVDDPTLAFPIISVSTLNIDYSIDLPDNVVDMLEVTSVESLLVMNITSIPQDDPKGTTINLLAPLIFNVDTQKAGQIVLSGSGYDISYPMFKNN